LGCTAVTSGRPPNGATRTCCSNWRTAEIRPPRRPCAPPSNAALFEAAIFVLPLPIGRGCHRPPAQSLWAARPNGDVALASFARDQRGEDRHQQLGIVRRNLPRLAFEVFFQEADSVSQRRCGRSLSFSARRFAAVDANAHLIVLRTLLPSCRKRPNGRQVSSRSVRGAPTRPRMG
jgi:hypothetical protein